MSDDASIPAGLREAIRRLSGGRYRIRRRLGRGGMAAVYVAEDGHLGDRVAIKALHRHLMDNPEHCTRFRREAESVARLDHPGLLEIYELLEEPGDLLAIVMEYVDGPSLDELLETSPPLPPELAVEVLSPVLRALDHTHREGIVHRDLKPANILVGDAGRPRLTDFGVAHVGDRQTLTDTGKILGSPAFMSPEGVEDAPIDHRTDLFSIGSLLYQMVTGTPAFSGRAPSTVMRNIARGNRRRADFVREQIGRRFADILETLLCYDPEDRPESAASAADLLEDFRADTFGDHPPSVRRWVRAPKRYPATVRERLYEAIFERATEAVDNRNRCRALPLVERLMALAPDDARADALLDRLHDTAPVAD